MRLFRTFVRRAFYSLIGLVVVGAILACIDASTGDLKWTGNGYQELARFPAIEGKTWNHLAMSDGILLVRNIEEMAAFDLRNSPW